MKKISVIIQASSISWSGGKDLCMNQMEGKPVLYHTINELLSFFGEKISNLWLVAPEFDQGGLEFVKSFFSNNIIQTYYGFNDSPLERMINVTRNLKDEDYVLRVNGINFCVDSVSAQKNLKMAEDSDLDCVRFPDNFPSLFTSDVYRVGALRRMYSNYSTIDRKYYIHPKYYFSSDPNFSCKVSEPEMSKYSDEYLMFIRKRYKNTMHAKRIDVDVTKAIKQGDTIQFHYVMASTYIKGTRFVLDLACGSGFGTKMLSTSVGRIVGVDNDNEMIDLANKSFKTNNIGFIVSDVLDLPFDSDSIDALVAFEIIEHVAPDRLLKEISRVLKPGGTFCLSTPQNSLGHVPSTSDHLREFSLNEIKSIVGEFFQIIKIIGIKQGSIYFEDDPIGSSSFVVAKKKLG